MKRSWCEQHPEHVHKYPVSVSEKTCSRCDLTKPSDDFRANGQNRDGLRSYCKSCEIAYNNAQYHKHPDRVQALRRARFARDPEAYERKKERSRVYYRRNSDRILTNFRANYLRNRDSRMAVSRAYYRKNKASWKAYARHWHEAHPEQARLGALRRYYLRRNAEGSHTNEDWQALCAWFGNVCLCCGAAGPLTVDHVVPISQGGSNNVENLQPLCHPCNCSKQTKIMDYRDPERLKEFLDCYAG